MHADQNQENHLVKWKCLLRQKKWIAAAKNQNLKNQKIKAVQENADNRCAVFLQ